MKAIASAVNGLPFLKDYGLLTNVFMRYPKSGGIEIIVAVKNQSKTELFTIDAEKLRDQSWRQDMFIQLERDIFDSLTPKPKRPLSGTNAHLQKRGPQFLRPMMLAL